MALVVTDDGSHSFLSPQFGVLYHSRHGAIQETECVFINAGLRYFKSHQIPSINILEIGFGTGLNAFMTYLEAEKLGISIHYTTLEMYPLSIADAELLNYPTQLQAEDKIDIFNKMHSSEWGKDVQLSNSFIFQKLKIDFKEVNFHSRYDLIYFDAFAPESQPELWDNVIFEKMYLSLKKEGILTTYCAKGAVKRTLKSVGFSLEFLPGPPGKREMTRAIKK